jgi:hypothetical protein
MTTSKNVPASRRSVLRFLIALTLLLLASPFLEEFKYGDLLEAVLITLMLVSAVAAVSQRGRMLAWGIALVIPALAGKWINHFWHDPVSPSVYLISGLVFLIFVVAQFLHFILRAPRVNSEVLCAGISAYLLLGLLWAFGYLLVARLVPHAFAFNGSPLADPQLHGFDAVYFSFITLSTVGFGDFTPVAGAARMLAAAEAMTGTLFVAVLISRLVALYSAQGPSLDKDEGKKDP